MAEPLTIYECPACGHRAWSDVACVGGRMAPNHGAEHQIARCQPVRVFREEEVRERVLIWQVWVGELQQQLRAHGLLQLQSADPSRPMPEVFLGEDVRPLWEAVKNWDETREGTWRTPLTNAFDAFPVPEEWKT